MEILDRIDKERKAQNKSQAELCKYIGISKNAYTNWKSGHMKSYEKYLPVIAEFLNVSVDYLLGNSEKKEKAPDTLTEREQTALNLFNSMSEEQQEHFIAIMEATIKNRTEN